MASQNGPLRIGIGGPVGAGKTTLAAALARILHPYMSIGVITNDIYTQEDAEALMRKCEAVIQMLKSFLLKVAATIFLQLSARSSLT